MNNLAHNRPRGQRFEITLACFLAASLSIPCSAARAASPVSFAQDIRPILSDKCFACHGPDENAREADLRLVVRDEAVATGALIPGDADESELLRRIVSDDEDLRMPPRHTQKEISSDEVELIRRWISAGAEYEIHWAYRPLVRPAIPVVKHDRNGSEIDAFLLSDLIDQQLDFSPRANRVTLIRRLYLDLLGVPPSPSEVDAFASDESPTARADLVDRLLKDTHFGERMAVYWLDLVRYADTIGYHSDTYMEVSAYRDYVIAAFNDNKPFDQFTVEQLAGDLLPEPTQSQLIASGYNRLLQTTEEGGAQAKEYEAIYAADRVRNVAGVWMGATVGCAQCHDHKYDPITSRDFYSLAAFFSDIKENAVGKRKPNLKIYTEQDKQRIAELKSKIESLKLPALLQSDPQLAETLAAGQQQWEARAIAAEDAGDSSWASPTPRRVDATGDVVLQRQGDGSYLSSEGNPNQGTYTIAIDWAQPIQAIRLEVFSDDRFPSGGFARGNGNFVLTGLSVSAGDRSVPLARAAADYQQDGWPVAAAIDDNKTSGWAIDGHHKKAEKRVAVFYPSERIVPVGDDSTLTIRMSHESAHAKHLVGRFRISVSDDPAAAIGGVEPLAEEVLAAIRTDAGERTESQQQLLAEHYRETAPDLQPWKKKLADAEQELQVYEAGIRTMLVTETLSEPRVTRILPRGNWLDQSGEVVPPAVPQFLASGKVDDRRANRLDLAQWLVAEDNPLTSRTFVNRLWKLFFGRGLSRNLDDLGGQGQPPTHPELLDWLAVEFRSSGWDIKHLIRKLVTSEAYAQSSAVSPELRSIDPQNRWFTSQGRWRLDAEFVRDNLLQVSGLLSDHQVGGRSVKPYQPAGYWQHLNFPKREWQAEQDDRLYRRSLYTFWCRTFLHPSMLAFDATSREECTAERAKSNIPQQALVLLNDPTFLEASRVFAGRIIDTDGNEDAKVRWAMQEAVSRSPVDQEVALLVSLYRDQLRRYQDAPDDAMELLSVGAAENRRADLPAELAAWTQVARAIFNLYETTSRY
jgi:hypothetical protein